MRTLAQIKQAKRAKVKSKITAKRKAKVKVKPIIAVNHTTRAYNSLSGAYVYLNSRLFDAQLPHCLITVQRKKGSNGYFSKDRFTNEGSTTDEIALNPANFLGRTSEQVLATLAHEMVHLWQHHFGEPGRGYHNRQWADKMKLIGLQPTSDGTMAGKETGKKIGTLIMPEGLFIHHAKPFLARGGLALYADAISAEGTAIAKVKAASKTKYTCAECGINAWAKPDTSLICGECENHMTCDTDVERKAA